MTSTKPPLDVYRRAVFRTKRIRIRPARALDQILMFGWRSDADTSRFLSGDAPESMKDQRDWFDRIRSNTSYGYHIVEDRGVPIGYTSMFNADPATSDAEWGLVMGKNREPGDVRIVAPLCCTCAFKFGGLDAVYTCINENNSGAVRRVKQIGAKLFEGSSAYRKKGELLFKIGSDEFEKALLGLADSNPTLIDDLDVEMYVE